MPVLLPARRIIYTLGCWAKGDSVPLTSGTGRKFGIVLRFINNDVIVGEETASFNPDCSSQNDWRYLSMRVAAKRAYTSTRIVLVYECNANVVYFQNAAEIRLQSIWATVEYPVFQGKEIIYGIVQQGGVIKFMP